MKKVYLIQYKNTKNDYCYCLNEWTDSKGLLEWWKNNETPQGYKIQRILDIFQQEQAKKYLENHKTLRIKYTQKNHDFMNKITDFNFDVFMFKNDYTHNKKEA